jgi:hypothetical protein
VSNRQIAKVIGVDHKTVAADVGENSPAQKKKANSSKASKAPSGESSPLTGSAAAATVAKAEAKEERQAAKHETRKQDENAERGSWFFDPRSLPPIQARTSRTAGANRFA